MQTLTPPYSAHHTGESHSLWMDEKLQPFPPLTQNITTDVCIVGGGIVGLTCAYFLLKRGLSVAVIEAGSIGGGQSTRTTGHLAWALDDRYFDLATLFGLEGARMACDSHREAIKVIEKIIKEEQITCDFEKLDAYLFLAPEDSPTILQKEWETLQKMGIPVKKRERAPIQSFDTGPCLQFPDHAQFHIIKYLKGLIDAILKKNGKIFAHTHAQQIEDGSPCKVATDHHLITAKSVIVATNSPINDRFMIHSKQSAYRTYAIAGNVPKNSIAKALYYDTPDPYHYIRLQKNDTHPTKEWLIVGGEDHKTGQDENVFEKYICLEEWTRKRFPEFEKVDYRWSGQVIEPIDSLAYIGRNPHDEHIYIATGDSGNGLTHATIAGLLLTGLIMDGFHPWADLYDPSRKNLHAFGEFTKENLNVAGQYGEWFMPGEVETIQDIPLGEGAVIREGLKKYAVYRDENGKVHCFSAVCPHLGGIVRWNPGEKSWDCPCHGSRFNTEGEVLNGPAIDGLARSPELQ